LFLLTRAQLLLVWLLLSVLLAGTAAQALTPVDSKVHLVLLVLSAVVSLLEHKALAALANLI
jgi:hypothetical protein